MQISAIREPQQAFSNRRDGISTALQTAKNPITPFNDQILFSGKVASCKKNKKKAKWLAGLLGLGGFLVVGSGSANKVPYINRLPGHQTVTNIDLFDLPSNNGFLEEFKLPASADSIDTTKNSSGFKSIANENVLINQPTTKSKPISNSVKARLERLTSFTYQTVPQGKTSFETVPMTAETEKLKLLVLDRMAYLLQARPDVLNQFEEKAAINGGTIPIKLFDSNSFSVGNQQNAAGLFTCNYQGFRNGGQIDITKVNFEILLTTPNIATSYENSSGQASYDIITHEFMHFLESMDNNKSLTCDADGIPGWISAEEKSAYIEARDAEKTKIANRQSLLYDYAITNDREFLAVLAETFVHNPQGLLDSNPVLFNTMKSFFGFNPIENPPVSNYLTGTLDPLNLNIRDFNPDTFMNFEYYTPDDKGGFQKTNSPSPELLESKRILISRLFGIFQNRPDLLYAMQNNATPERVIKVYESNGDIGVLNGTGYSALLNGNEFKFSTGVLQEIKSSPHNNYDILIWMVGNVVDSFQGQSNGLYKVNAADTNGLLPGWSQQQQDSFIQLRQAERQKISSGKSVLGNISTTNDRDFLTATMVTFFENPQKLKDNNLGLYTAMSDFFKLDPLVTPVFPNI